MKRLALGLALACLLALGGQTFAGSLATGGPLAMGAIEATPAATLLLPYFEVTAPGGDPAEDINTLFTIKNASAAPTIAHVTVWSNKSIPVFDFDIYLTGYDVVSISLRDVLINGNLPVTYWNRIPAGAFSDPNVNFPRFPAGVCGNTPGDPPRYNNPALSGAFLAHVQAFLTGQQSPVTGRCASAPTANLVGYITVDDVDFCSLLFPSDAGYFINGGQGVASNDNQLWGEWFIVDTANDFAQGETLVHIEAQTNYFGGPNSYTFYGRYTEPTFDDNREPLATVWATDHFTRTPPFDGTDVLVWRDSTVDEVDPFTCGGGPSWEPLDQKQIVIFDEEENPVIPEGGVSGEPEERLSPFPEETQRVAVGGPTLSLPTGWENGWLYLNLNHLGNDNLWATDLMSAQSWVIPIFQASGKFSAGFDAIQLDNAQQPFTGVIP